MASYNRVILLGNLVRDPEIRYIQSGSAVAKFTIAVNPNKKEAKPEETTFVNIVAWERLAETCNTFLKKGSPVLVEGRLAIRSYEDQKLNDQNGQAIRRTAVEVVISQMQMLGSKRDGNGNAETGETGSANAEPIASDAELDEIPF